jgi:hypothetical protein
VEQFDDDDDFSYEGAPPGLVADLEYKDFLNSARQLETNLRDQFKGFRGQLKEYKSEAARLRTAVRFRSVITDLEHMIDLAKEVANTYVKMVVPVSNSVEIDGWKVTHHTRAGGLDKAAWSRELSPARPDFSSDEEWKAAVKRAKELARIEAAAEKAAKAKAEAQAPFKIPGCTSVKWTRQNK